MSTQPPENGTPAGKDPRFAGVSGGVEIAEGAGGSDVSAEVKTYTVKPGDSLSKIAKALYGDANRWKEIHAANREEIKDPDKIFPGQVLRLP